MSSKTSVNGKSNSKSIRQYLLILTLILIGLSLIASIWGILNYRSLLNAFRDMDRNRSDLAREISQLTIRSLPQLNEDSLRVADAQVLTDIRLITEPYYITNSGQLLIRSGQQYREYQGPAERSLRRLVELQSLLQSGFDESTYLVVITIFVCLSIGLFIAILAVYLQLNRRLNRNMENLLISVNQPEATPPFDFTEFSELDARFKQYREKTLQVERQQIAADVLTNWQLEVKKIIHDLKNPLQRIKMTLSNLDEAADTALANDALDEIQIQLKEIRSTDAQMDINLEEIDIHAFFERLRQLFYDVKIELVTTLTSPFHFDPFAFQRITSNVIQNAIDAGATTVTFSFLETPTEIALEMINDGPPIVDPDTLFIPFSTTKANGSGLGLSIVLQFVHLHGGVFFLKHSNRDETVFRMELSK